ncbi:DUF1573 domain-containing protein [Psychroserpens mesophilus]|uniref:DUF1573 domain-containing protein n=1 Tax=Psychroserpens mesophilus TaxID=325473 RepID=UPI0006939F34|nr:DUF1573 domain-containing protein [Psychroserpens mesophilus]
MKHQVRISNRNQKNHIITLISMVCMLLFSCINFAQELESSHDIGVFHFDEEVIDYGTIAQNDNGIRTFKFTNRGRAPIVISNVKTTCGCTVPTYPKQAILPGETATIDIKYATNRVGSFSKTITIISNADERQKKLRIKGNVIAKPKASVN